VASLPVEHGKDLSRTRQPCIRQSFGRDGSISRRRSITGSPLSRHAFNGSSRGPPWWSMAVEQGEQFRAHLAPIIAPAYVWPATQGGTAMRRMSHAVVLTALLLAAPCAMAGDVAVMTPIGPALDTPHAHRELRSAVRFYFGKQVGPSVAQNFGSVVVHRRSVINAQDPSSCDRVFIAVLADLAKRASDAGGNAVVNIESFYKEHAVTSETAYECHRGAAVTAVTLRGDLVRLTGP
jgi:hypothetical protein